MPNLNFGHFLSSVFLNGLTGSRNRFRGSRNRQKKPSSRNRYASSCNRKKTRVHVIVWGSRNRDFK